MGLVYSFLRNLHPVLGRVGLGVDKELEPRSTRRNTEETTGFLGMPFGNRSQFRNPTQAKNRLERATCLGHASNREAWASPSDETDQRKAPGLENRETWGTQLFRDGRPGPPAAADAKIKAKAAAIKVRTATENRTDRIVNIRFFITSSVL